METSLFQPIQHYDPFFKFSEDQEWYPFKMHFDYSNNNKTSRHLLQILQTQVIPAVGAYFEQALKVQKFKSRIFIDDFYLKKTCGIPKLKIPQKHIKKGVEADSIFYITLLNEPFNNYIAYASICPQGKGFGFPNGRPTVGYFAINEYYFQKDIDRLVQDPTLINQWIWTTLHEITHSLVFSPHNFKRFIREKNPMKQFEDGRFYIIAPSVLEYAKKYFNCEQMKGVPLEDEGGEGTEKGHWDRKTFGNEVMTGSSTYDNVFTKFTLLIFYASGWYDVEWSQSQQLTWGYGEGCKFLSQKCDYNSKEFCDLNDGDTGLKCTYDYVGIGNCHEDQLANSCGYFKSRVGKNCNYPSKYMAKKWIQEGGSFGKNTRCFQTSKDKQNLGICFESKCDFDNKFVYFKAFNQWYKCEKDGQVLKVNGVEISCP
ncbi:leishmanolysin family protein, putative, partial [Ichthyophthirius multifiliis]